MGLEKRVRKEAWELERGERCGREQLGATEPWVLGFGVKDLREGK